MVCNTTRLQVISCKEAIYSMFVYNVDSMDSLFPISCSV